jgi:mannose-6-phosphate isomerase-like protein (cupin superfamily)
MASNEQNLVAHPHHARKATLDEASALLPSLETRPRSASVFRHGSMLVKLFAPRGADVQTPHKQDELYFVARGTGWFVNGDTRTRFAPNDMLFVPANVVHRFEDFSDDLMIWVVFYGPEGGE